MSSTRNRSTDKATPADKARVFIDLWRMYATEYAHLEARHCEHPDGELLFHPRRKWRFDWCIPALRIAVEIDGGNMLCRYSRKLRRHIPVGHHVMSSDYEKLNAAVELGWTVLRFTTDMLRRQPDQCVAQVKRVVRNVLTYYETKNKAEQ